MGSVKGLPHGGKGYKRKSMVNDSFSPLIRHICWFLESKCHGSIMGQSKRVATTSVDSSFPTRALALEMGMMIGANIVES